MKILGIDYGDARTGLSVSDPTGMLAGSPSVIAEWNRDKLLDKLVAYIKDNRIEEIVLGLPRNMDGTEGFQSQKVRALAEQLEKAGLNILYQDERLTTVTAERALIEGGMHRQERRGTVDKVAAAVILQQYLDTLRHQQG